MKLSDFDYKLPAELIAQEPLKERSESKLMVVEKNKIEHKKFSDVAEYFKKDDVLVLNNTKVIPARIFGKKQTGGKVEVLLIKKKTAKTWACLYSGKNINEGTKLFFEREIEGTISKKANYDIEIKFNKKIEDLLDEIGEMPTPPYVKKKLGEKERYNTIFAEKKGSVAAPTAGLHFTKELLDKLSKKGIKICFVTLHVGLGTFMPVKEEEIEKHKMHSEYYEISKKTANTINSRKGRLIVVGTTTLRTLESNCDAEGKINAGKGATNIFIYPPYNFKLKFDAMITNFHLPKSTLLMLISAIIGREKMLEAYTVAIQQKYRFFSFGDAMLIIK